MREDEVTIDAVTLPFDVSVRAVHVFADRLWISLDVGFDGAVSVGASELGLEGS